MRNFQKDYYIEYDNNGFLVGLFDGEKYVESDAPAHICQLSSPAWKGIQVVVCDNYHLPTIQGILRF